MTAVKLHKFCFYKLRRVFITCNQNTFSFDAYGLKNQVKNFIDAITVKSFCIYEVFILDIVLDNFLIDFVCFSLFRFLLFG